VFTLLPRPQPVGLDAELRVPFDPHVAPILIPFHRLGWVAEEFDLHLLEFTASERIVARIDLIAEGLADLADAERKFEARAIQDVVKVHEDTLSGLRTEVGQRRF